MMRPRLSPVVADDDARMLVADFDSVRQAELWTATGREPALQRWRAALRAADLLSQEIVVTDAQLLDGIYFLLLGPDGIAETLGRGRDERIPIRVMARNADLGAAWHTMRCSNGFRSSSEHAARSGGVAVEILEEGRQAWIDAVAAARLEVTVWANDFPFGAVMAAMPDPATSRCDAVVEELRSITNRSTAIAFIDAQVHPAERPVVRRWWDEAYAGALARQHGAAWISLDPARGEGSASIEPRPRRNTKRLRRVLRAVGTLFKRTSCDDSGGSDLRLDGEMLAILSAAPPAVYGAVRHYARDASREWVDTRSCLALRSLALVVRETTAVPSSWSERRSGAIKRTTLLGGAAVAAAGLELTGGPVLVVVVVALLAGLPWSEFTDLTSTRPGRLRGVVHVEPTGPRA